MRVIDRHSIATNAGHRFERNRLAESGRCVFKLGLGVLVAGKLDMIPPSLQIPVALNEPAHLGGVAHRQVLSVRRTHEPVVRKIAWPPLPRGPEDVQRQGLHHAGGNVDQKALNIAPRHGF